MTEDPVVRIIGLNEVGVWYDRKSGTTGVVWIMEVPIPPSAIMAALVRWTGAVFTFGNDGRLKVKN